LVIRIILRFMLAFATDPTVKPDDRLSYTTSRDMTFKVARDCAFCACDIREWAG
jgi:hypothetical protein